MVASGDRAAPNTSGGSADALAGAPAVTVHVAGQKLNRAPRQRIKAAGWTWANAAAAPVTLPAQDQRNGSPSAYRAPR